MGRSLVIVESPKKATTIGKYLGKDYIVKSSKGHIRDLKKGKFYTLKQLLALTESKSGSRLEIMGVDPDNDWEAHYVVQDAKRKVVSELKAAAKHSDTVYLATDLDREGEAIAWHLQEVLGGSPERFRRVVFNEITKCAIQSAFTDPGIVNINRVNAQQARRFLDRVVGFELTPLLYAKVARKLSGGRVQSIAVRLVVEREREIRAFNVEEYWEIFSHITQISQSDSAEKPTSYKFKVIKYKGAKFSASTETEASIAVDELQGNKFVVASHEKRETKSQPSPPFITSTLQQAASTRLGFSVRRTMNAAQRLYESGHISYMRTDSTNLSTESVDSVRGFINKQYSDQYLPDAPKIYRSKSPSAQEAHEAIRPTDVNRTPDRIDVTENDQKRLYDLIWRRFVSCQMTPAQYQSVTTLVDAGDYQLSIKGRVVIFDGFTRVYRPAARSEDQQLLPDFAIGELLKSEKTEKVQRFTKPPTRFSEASLVRELEKRGIGRPSTYVPIISTIQERGYVTVTKGRFHAERIGEIVTDHLMKEFANLMEYEFTANMEKELDRVAMGEGIWTNVLNDFYSNFREQFKRVANDTKNHWNAPIKAELTCPKCNNNKMLIRTASTGIFLACEGFMKTGDEKCSNTMSVSISEEPVTGDEDEKESRILWNKQKCSICSTPMDGFLIDHSKKIHICPDPNCGGNFVEEGAYETASFDGPTVECHKCGTSMELKSGRFGKYFACTNSECKTTRKMATDGSAEPPRADPIHMPELRCTTANADDYYVLREGASGLFLLASKYPKLRERRQPKVNELLSHANELDPKFKYLLDAPAGDSEGNPTVIRFDRKSREHYVSVAGKGKGPKWSSRFINGRWHSSDTA